MFQPLYPAAFLRQTGGFLIVDVKTSPFFGPSIPIEGASVIVRDFIPFEENTAIIGTLTTNEVGQTPPLPLPAPTRDLTEAPEYVIKPYEDYTVEVIAAGFEPFSIQGVQIFDTINAILPVFMTPSLDTRMRSRLDVDVALIGPPRLYGDYPPKIPESPLKDPSESNFIVLPEVVVPEFVVVHDGSPNNVSAPNLLTPYKDYIKNVASSEIYPTWPRETILANVVAITSFTLNRVYTEWYRNQGKDFTITSSTAFDHAFFRERDIFDTISVAVDEVFNVYAKKPNVIQPILTQYCDGAKVQCPNWMSQWGSKNLGDEGLDAQSILRFFYGEDTQFERADAVEGVPVSYPGSPLKLGDESPEVRTIQEQLNRIGDNYPLIPKVKSSGVFDEATEEAVKTFQKIFYLPQDGIVDEKTWYTISEKFVAVTKIAELT